MKFQTQDSDWESLGESIKQHGVRHSTLSAHDNVGEQFRCVKRNKWRMAPKNFLSIKKSKGNNPNRLFQGINT